MVETMDDATKAAFKEAFSAFDKDNDGVVNQNELGGILEGMGVKSTGAELKELLGLMDTSHDGKIDFDEFLAVMAAKMSAVKASEYVAIAYASFDDDNDGLISPEDLQKVFANVDSLKGLNVTNDEIAQIIEYFGKGDKLTKEEFTVWMDNP